MWKVKRMNTACIVVLAIAAGAGLTALRLASGVHGAPAPVAQPVAQLPTVDVLVAKSDIGLGQSVLPDDQPNWRGATVNMVRYGIASPPTVQK
jgi:pilus assembly protein CpaB